MREISMTAQVVLGRVVNSPGQGMWLLRATLRLDRRAG
jgi:hypothetical protein